MERASAACWECLQSCISSLLGGMVCNPVFLICIENITTLLKSSKKERKTKSSHFHQKNTCCIGMPILDHPDCGSCFGSSLVRRSQAFVFTCLEPLAIILTVYLMMMVD